MFQQVYPFLVGGLGFGAAACGPVNVHWEKYPTGTSTSLRAAEQHWWVNGGDDDAVYVKGPGRRDRRRLRQRRAAEHRPG